jgi:hypothetical protein
VGDRRRTVWRHWDLLRVMIEATAALCGLSNPGPVLDSEIIKPGADSAAGRTG